MAHHQVQYIILTTIGNTVQVGHQCNNQHVPHCKGNTDTNVMTLGTMISTPSEAGLNLDKS